MLRTLTLALAVTAAIPAQTLRGTDVLVTNYRTGNLFRIDAAGAVTPLAAAAASLTGPSGITADIDGGAIVCDADGDRLVRVAPDGSPTVIASGLGTPLRVAVDHDGSYVVTTLRTRGLARVSRSGAVTPLIAGGTGGIVRCFDVIVDGDGSYVICDDQSRGVYRVTRNGTVTPIAVGLPFRLPQGAALFPNGDYAVFDGLTDSLFRVDRATGAISTWVTTTALGGNPCGIDAAGDGGFFVSQSSASSNRVVRVDATGAVSVLAADGPFTNLEVCTVLPIVTGPATVTTGPGSATTLGIDVPSQPGAIYALGMSAALFPGLGLPGESRALTLRVDGLLLNTLGTSIPPFLSNWFAPTDPQGRGTAGLDLSLLPPQVLAGRTFFVQALVFDPNAPNGIGAISTVRPLAFR